jgi:hypothetical protein
MSVIPLTIFFSLLLAGFFVAMFWREQRQRRFGGPERESLLPLAEEESVVAGQPAVRPGADGVDPPVGPRHSNGTVP